MATQLQQLGQLSCIVADTGDLAAIRRWQPQDATTNPSLLLAAARQPENAAWLAEARAHGAATAGSSSEQLAAACDHLAVRVGSEITALVPGYVSTEVDARLSFDQAATLARARGLIAGYRARGISAERVLIKIAATWEGIAAAAVLEREGIHCNLTLLFNFAQAVAAADGGVTLISPFVGRISDYYKAAQGVSCFRPEQDPGVLSVKAIYNHYKQHGYRTIVMGASFRSAEQVLALAGCDRLTISPALLAELATSELPVIRQLDPAQPQQPAPAPLSESAFRWQLNECPMTCDKLADGIRRFARDQEALELLLQR